MALEYRLPSLVGNGKGYTKDKREKDTKWTLYTSWTATVPTDIPLEKFVDENYRALINGYRTISSKSNNTLFGMFFELCVYNLVHHVLLEEGLSNPGQYLLVGKDMRPPYNADVDLLVCETLAVFAKTSMRERWKQVDRDCKAIVEAVPARTIRDNFRAWSVFNTEHLNDSLIATQQKAKNYRERSLSPLLYVSVRDHTAMREFISDIRWSASKVDQTSSPVAVFDGKLPDVPDTLF